MYVTSTVLVDDMMAVLTDDMMAVLADDMMAVFTILELCICF